MANKQGRVLGDFYLNAYTEIAVAVVAAMLLALVLLQSPLMALVALGGLAVLVFFAKSPLYAAALLIFFLPFSQIEQVAENLLPIPGTKPVLLLGAFVGLIAFANFRNSIKMTRLQRLFSIFLLSVFIITALRGIPHVPLISEAKDEPLTVVRYLLSYLVKPFIFFIPFLVIAKFVEKKQHLDFVATTITVGMLAFASYFLYHYVFNVPNKGNIEAAWEYVAAILNFHKNAASALFVVTFPIILGRYFAKKDLLGLVAVIASVFAIAFMYSRTAYLTAMVSILIFMLLSRRTKYLPLIAAIGMVFLLLISSSVLERATKGIAEREDIDVIAAGRVERFWKPIVGEYIEQPQKFIIGQGKFSIFQTSVFQSGVTLPSDHPHNMYLELVTDAGFAGFIPLMTLYMIIFFTAFKSLGKIRDRQVRDYQCAALAAMLSYFMGGMTQGSLMPDLENTFLFIAVAFSLAILRYVENQETGMVNANVEGPQDAKS